MTITRSTRDAAHLRGMDGQMLRTTRRLASVWVRRGLFAALSTVDHKIIGRRYLVTAFVFFVLAG